MSYPLLGSGVWCGWVLTVAWFSAVSLAQQLDPINNMCLRHSHQSVVKNDKLYIEGGVQSFVDVVNSSQQLQGNITLDYYLIVVDLTRPWDWKSNLTEVALTKTANPDTHTIPPSLANGALFQGLPSDPNIYSYGGTTSWWNISFPGFEAPTPETYSLWSYNTVSKEWNQYDITPGSPWRPSSGAYTEAPEQGLAFYFNGELDSGSSQRTQGFGDYVKVFLEGMVIVNTTARTATNMSTSSVTGGQPRTRGSMLYIPDIGMKGIIVALGGTYKPANDLDNEEIANFVSLSEVDVFDVSSYYTNSSGLGAWYTQNTTGDIPAARAQFCSVIVSAPDNSSHNIYIYGGRGSSNTYFDDVYILSIPSFIWTQVFGPGDSPRYSHTCHLVGKRQMLTVGGALGPDSKDPCDWEVKGVGILDLSTMTWGSMYDPYNGTYQVPSEVVANIGGSPHGNASMRQPKAGFTNAGIAGLFGVEYTNGTAVAHARRAKRRMIEGAAGGPGSAIVLLCIVLIIWQRRKKLGPRAGSYTVGIICALSHEKAAVVAMLDQQYPWRRTRSSGDVNSYTFGRIGAQNIIIVCLPAGNMGKAAAANVVTNLRRSFPSIKNGLMVGIAGGIWSIENDVRLGDVVVSQPQGEYGGVVNSDYGKVEVQGFRRTGNLDAVPAALRSAVSSLQAVHRERNSQIPEYLKEAETKSTKMSAAFRHPGLDNDKLFEADYVHTTSKTCENCDSSRLVSRNPRHDTDPRIHYGIISSADYVLRDAATRDKLAKDYGAIAVEMEAAGLMNIFPCAIIKGVCDYADSHKNKEWQPYAAAVAAAYARELLLSMTDAHGKQETASKQRLVRKDRLSLWNRIYTYHKVPKSESESITLTQLTETHNLV